MRIHKSAPILSFFVLLTFLGTMSAFAAETGSIVGKAVDNTGMGLPGVTVTATSTSLIGARTATTNSSGKFRLPILPVGVYTLTFDLTGYRPMKLQKITVKLGVDTPVTAKMQLAESVKEEIVVVADIVPLVDTKSANVSTFVDSAQIEKLPSGREFRDIMKFDPGVTGVRTNTVSGTSGDGLPSVRGEGQYGNNYLIDGLSVRDPSSRGTGVPLNFQAIEEIQIITDGFNPEYGMALGGIVNVVTKTGGNNFSGEVAWIYESDALTEDSGNGLWDTDREYTDSRPYVALGGPVIKDKLWFFTTYERRIGTETIGDKSITNDDGDVIDTLPGGDSDTTYNNFFLKFTYQINPNNMIALQGTLYNSELGNQGIDELRKPEARYAYTSDQNRMRLNYKSVLSDTTVLEFKAGVLYRERGVESDSGNTDNAQYQNLDTGFISNNFDNSDKNISERQDVLLQGTQYLELGGSHEIKAGIGYYWTNASRDLDWYGTGEDIFPNDTFDGGSWYEFEGDNSQPKWYYEGRDVSIENNTNGTNFYLQDIFSPMENLNVMIGFRMDSQDVMNNEKQTMFYIPMTDTFSPRATVTWDITSDSANIVKFGIGRFYDVVSTSLAEWGNTESPFSYRKFKWYGPTDDEWTNMSDEQRQSALHNASNWGDRDGNTGNPDQYYSEQSGESTPIDYDPELKPYYKDEYLIEYDRKLSERYVVKARYVESHTRDLIEDVGLVDYDGSVTGNEGGVYFLVINWDEKRRDYKSIELEFNGRPTDNTSFYVSYVNSEAKGTNPGQFERGGYQASWGSGNEVGVFGDHFDGKDNYAGLGGVLYGDEGWYGYLPYSVDHQIKLRGFYNAPYGFVVGTSFEWNSGYHWSKRGNVGAYGFSSFPEGRGSREMPSIYYWDLSLEKAFSFGDKYELALRLDIFNLTNADTAISYVQQDTEIFGETLKTQDPRSIRITARFSF